MRRASTLAFAGIIVAHLAGCGAAAKEAAPEAPRSFGPNDAVTRTANAAPRDREVDAAEQAYAKSAPASPAPPPAGQPGTTAGGMNATTPATTENKPKAEPSKEAAPSREFVIYTARFVMAVYQVDQGIAAIERIARENGGYLSIKKDREITIRIPRQRFDAAVGSVDKIGDVLHRDISAEDVTDEHVDLEIRIKNSRAMQHQLTALLTRANVKEALEIEKELHRVTEELERLEGRMKLLNDKIAFSTITVTFEPRGTTLTTQRPRLPFPWLSGLNLPTLLQLNEDK